MSFPRRKSLSTVDGSRRRGDENCGLMFQQPIQGVKHRSSEKAKNLQFRVLDQQSCTMSLSRAAESQTQFTTNDDLESWLLYLSRRALTARRKGRTARRDPQPHSEEQGISQRLAEPKSLTSGSNDKLHFMHNLLFLGPLMAIIKLLQAYMCLVAIVHKSHAAHARPVSTTCEPEATRASRLKGAFVDLRAKS